jgi:hypothetical protein
MSTALIGRIPKVKLVVNGLPLPQSIIDLIKDFIFLHPEEWMRIKRIKETKETIIFPFTVSRIRCGLNAERLGGWEFHHSYAANPRRFKARNCTTCGDYIVSQIYYRFLCKTAKCLCGENALRSRELYTARQNLLRRHNIANNPIGALVDDEEGMPPLILDFENE